MDLVFLNMAAILGMRWLSTAAQMGDPRRTIPRAMFFSGVFAALPALRRKGGIDQDGFHLVPFGSFGPWVFGGMGFGATALSVVLALIPPEGSTNPMLFVWKVGGGCLLFVAAGLVFCYRNRR